LLNMSLTPARNATIMSSSSHLKWTARYAVLSGRRFNVFKVRLKFIFLLSQNQKAASSSTSLIESYTLDYFFDHGSPKVICVVTDSQLQLSSVSIVDASMETVIVDNALEFSCSTARIIPSDRKKHCIVLRNVICNRVDRT
jgi:hypothetical protein